VKRSRRVSLALVGLCAWVTACTSYSRIELSEVADCGRVRVTKTDGERQTIREPELDSEVIRGIERDERRVRIIPVDSIATVERPGINWPLTAGLTVLAVGGALYLAAFWRGAEEYSDMVDSINRSLDQPARPSGDSTV